jgi:hypothetical protein
VDRLLTLYVEQEAVVKAMVSQIQGPPGSHDGFVE